MKPAATQHPTWPPGFWRRIVIQPGQNGNGRWIGGALEDDVHRFHLRLDHDGMRITKAYADALRHPWSACPGAAPHIVEELMDELLSEVANRDPLQHCTHLYDLAVVIAAHASDTRPTQFDMRVADKVDQRTTAMLRENGEEVLRWQLTDTHIDGPHQHAGRDLRQLSKWKLDLPTREAERATILRRAVFVSGGRQFVIPQGNFASDAGSHRLGVCFNYQLPRAASSTHTPNWRTDFSTNGGEPLAGFDSAAVFAAMA